MIPYEVYKLVHLFGIFLVLVALGGTALYAINGGTRDENRARRLTAVSHGLGSFVILLGGFGMLARLGIVQAHQFPVWIWAKVGIWILLSGVVLLPLRRPGLARPIYVAVPLLGALAGYLAIFHPI